MKALLNIIGFLDSPIKSGNDAFFTDIVGLSMRKPYFLHIVCFEFTEY